jgi:hypothetical protein
MEYPSCAEKSSSWHLTGEGTKEKVRWIRKTQPTRKAIGSAGKDEEPIYGLSSFCYFSTRQLGHVSPKNHHS